MKFLSILTSLFNQLRGKATATVNSDQARQLRARLLWEMVAVLLTFGIGYLVSHCTSQSVLETCQSDRRADEREALLKQHTQHQALLDSLHFSAKISQKDLQILQKDEEILLLSQRIRSDSIAHLTELQAIRAINQHLKQKK